MKKYLIVAWHRHSGEDGLGNIRDQSNDLHLAREIANNLASSDFCNYYRVEIYGRDEDGVIETIK